MLHYTFRLLAASQAIFLCLYFLLLQRNAAGLLIAASSLGLFAYLIVPVARDIWGIESLYILFALLSSSIPSFLWLLGRWFFSDDRDVPFWFWMYWFVYLILFLPNWIVLELNLSSEVRSFFFLFVPQIMKLALVLHVIYVALSGRHNDLVAQRLRLRVPIALTASICCAVVILVEIWLRGLSLLVVEKFASVLFFFIILAGNLCLFRHRDDLQLADLVIPRNEEDVTVDNLASKNESAMVQRIEDCMQQGRFYANQSTSIGVLASQLGVPEYRLRRIINQQMGYRNFNHFLNHYRIEEATERLLRETHLPIISIALDVGFKSLSSFNKAFRDTHGKTPTSHRNV